MINIELNGEPVQIEPTLSLTALLEARDYTDNSFAVAINQLFIPRSQYKTTIIHPDDRIEILRPMQGG